MTEIKTISSVAWRSVKVVAGIRSDSIKDILDIEPSREPDGLENTYSVASTSAEDPGRGGYISIANPSEYHMVDGEGNDESFSVSTWAKISALPYYRFFCKGTTSAAEYLATTWGGAGTAMNFVLYSDDGGTQYINQYTTHGMSADTWYNVVFVYEAGQDPAQDGLSFYVDGVQNTSGRANASYSNMNDSEANLEIFRQNGNSNLSDGWIDEVGFWTRALNGDEVNEIYNDGVPGNLDTHSAADDLMSWWRMGDTDDGSGTTVTDVQGTGDGTLSGTPAVFVEDVPGGD